MTQHWRIEVSPIDSRFDSLGRTALASLRDAGLDAIERVRGSRVYLIELAGGRDVAERVAKDLLTDPVTERFAVTGPDMAAAGRDGKGDYEVYPRPGVMDPAAASTVMAIADMGFEATSVRTGRRFAVIPPPAATDATPIRRLLANDCVEEVVEGTRPAGPPPKPADHSFQLRHVAIRKLDDAGLKRLSRDGHLFLSLEEMKAIREHYRDAGREPTDLELETLAQTWSEHCVHKTLKSAVTYGGAAMPGGKVETSKSQKVKTGEDADSPPQESTVEIRYDNLLRDTIARATKELMAEGRGPTCLSVFKDNAGVIAFDDEFGIAFKAETHNRPSAIEPYGGAATGVGGVIRDVLGCGLGAKPIANTDVFCVAPPDWPAEELPKGVIHPRQVLRGVVAGVRDYGNRMGIPTVNGAVHFDPRYLGNPLVFCGCVGLIPRDKIEKAARPGDAVVVVGGRTGRDGIHGATFSSAELTDTHADEFSHAVQIGNAIEEKKALDVILQARDFAGGCLYSSITDCGAGGLSSAVGEMAAEIGAEIDLENVPLKYEGLRYDEVWISESQERMVLSVPPANVARLIALCAAENVEATVIGTFTNSRRLSIRFRGQVVGELDCHFLHEGVPKTVRAAEWQPANGNVEKSKSTKLGAAESESTRTSAPSTPRHLDTSTPSSPADMVAKLKTLLASPTIASKEWIIRQYDHEVLGRSVIKPLVGVMPGGPSDAAVIRPRLGSNRGIAIGCGLCPQLSDIDPYWMAVAAIDEAIRNVVCVGGDPAQTAILDNFCWGRCDDPRTMGALVRACQGCYDAAKAYGVPFISGKDSLNNEFALDPADVERVRDTCCAGRSGGADPIRNGRLAIPGTLLISAVSIIDDVSKCVTMDLKQAASRLFLVGQPTCFSTHPFGDRPAFGLATAIHTHQFVATAIRDGLIASAHDVSDGGILTACAEMCIAGDCGSRIHGLGGWCEKSDSGSRSPLLQGGKHETPEEFYFAEAPAMYVVAVGDERFDEFSRRANSTPSLLIGTRARELELEDADGIQTVTVGKLRALWNSTLRW